MPTLDNELLLAVWLDGELTEEQHVIFMQRCADDPDFAAIVKQANDFTQHSDVFNTWSVPQWNRLAAMQKQETWLSRMMSQWHINNLNTGMVSVGLSCCALVIAVVTFNYQLNTQANIAQVLTEQDVDQLVQQKLSEQQLSSQALFAQYADALQTQQLATSKQLTEYLLSSSRQERKEDFAELVKFINEQRVNDQRFYAQQFNDLQDEIYANNSVSPTISQE